MKARQILANSIAAETAITVPTPPSWSPTGLSAAAAQFCKRPIAVEKGLKHERDEVGNAFRLAVRLLVGFGVDPEEPVKLGGHCDRYLDWRAVGQSGKL